MKDFADRLQELMDQRGWNATEVANQSKNYNSTPITKANMSQWLNRKHREPDADKIYTLSQIFSVNPNYFMGNTDIPEYNMDELANKKKYVILLVNVTEKKHIQLFKCI